jgi:hypothetical protein
MRRHRTSAQSRDKHEVLNLEGGQGNTTTEVGEVVLQTSEEIGFFSN